MPKSSIFMPPSARRRNDLRVGGQDRSGGHRRRGLAYGRISLRHRPGSRGIVLRSRRSDRAHLLRRGAHSVCPGISKRLPCRRWRRIQLAHRWCPAMAETDAMSTMPSLGADMTDGTVMQWLVQPGDVVRQGDVVATIDTDKARIDAEIFPAGGSPNFSCPSVRGFRSEHHSPA